MTMCRRRRLPHQTRRRLKVRWALHSIGLANAFRPLTRSSPPFVNPPRDKNVTWLEPRLVAQIAFQEWTADQKLRQPVFLGLRDDKKPSEVLLPEK